MNKFKDLKLWQKSIEFVTKIYSKTIEFPKEEIYSLTSQLRRSAVSIPSNTTEGAGRGTHKEFSRFLDITRGSTYEVETQLVISRNLQFIDDSSFKELCFELEEIQKMMTGLQKNLTSKN